MSRHLKQVGSALIISYLFLAVLAAWLAVGVQQSTVELRGAQSQAATSRTFQVAEAGLDHALRWMKNLNAPPAGTTAFDPCTTGNPPLCAACPCRLINDPYTVTITPDPNNPTSYIDLFTIAVTAQLSATPMSRRLSMTLRTESFARYSYFTNSERLSNGTPIWFTTRDHLTGPVHSNDRFNIAGSPIFDGAVTSAAGSVNYKNPPPTGGNTPQFNGGLSLGVAPTRLPLTVTQLRVAASSAQGAWYTGNTAIVLQSNSTMLVTNPVLGWVNKPTQPPTNGAIFVNGGNVTVSGTLKGQLTIGTSNDVDIANNVTYATNPQTNPASSDILGLVAEKNVVVSQRAPYDLTIQASVMALNSSLSVENWWQGPPKGTLNVYGGIIQSARGPVGTFSGSTGNKLSGYSKNYQYDTRLSNLAPPFYPTSGSYQETLWQDNN